MKFIPISELERILGSEGNVRTADGRKELLLLLASGSAKGSGIYSTAELIDLVSSLEDETIVFCDWVEQDRNLKDLLTGEVITTPFQDAHHWKQHTLLTSFGKFLAPFLGPVSVKYRETKDLAALSAIFSYLPLLPMDERLTIERELFIPFRDQVELAWKNAGSLETEQELLTVSDAICNEQSIRIVNSLSRASYHMRIWFVDRILELVKHPACTARLAFRMTQRLKTIDLNPEHLETIDAIERDLKTGQLLAPKRKINFFGWFKPASLITVLLLVAVGVTVYFVATYKEEPDMPDDLNIASSFESFSKEERVRIDSLLRAQRKDENMVIPDQDQYLWPQGTGVSLALRKKLENERMEQLYQDWLLDAELHEQGILDTCSGKEPAFIEPFPNVLNVRERRGEHKVYVRNESDYAVYAFIFEDVRNGTVYEILIPKGKVATLELNKNDQLLFVAGKTLVPFAAPSGVPKEELPSTDFTHHFCEADMNLSLSLSTLYTFVFPSGDRNKLLLSGDDQNSFMVADLYGILETN